MTGEDQEADYTDQVVADWMWQQIQDLGELFQVDAVEHIRKHFGEQFIVDGTGIKDNVRKLMNRLAEGRVGYVNEGAPEDGYWCLKEAD